MCQCALRRHLHNQSENGIDDSKERPEIELGEEQWTIAVETKYVGEKLHFFSVIGYPVSDSRYPVVVPI